MPESFDSYPHIPLHLAGEGKAKSPTGGGGDASETTLANKRDTGVHGNKL